MLLVRGCLVEGNRHFSSMFKTEEATRYDNMLKSAMFLKSCTPSSTTFWRNVHKSVEAMSAKSPQIIVSTINSGEEVRELMEVFPQMVKDLTEAEEFTDVPLVNQRFARVLQYNVPTSTKSRSLLISRSYKSLMAAQNLTPENKKLAHILTWCFDMLETFTVIHDDIVDSSEIRRNSPCWYTLDGVGMSAANDGVYLENAAHFILKKYFSSHPMYVKFTELFHEAILMIVLGQTLDHIKATEAKANSNVFTMENYLNIRTYKAGHFPFYFPITLATYLADLFDPKVHEQLASPLAEMGYVLMVQNDFRDVFDNLSLNGEFGTDIKQGRYSWMIVTAHQVATNAQKEMLKRHYGSPDPESTLIVRDLYEELNLPKLCVEHIEERLAHVGGEFRRISGRSPHKAFFEYLGGLVVPKDWFAKEYWCT